MILDVQLALNTILTGVATLQAARGAGHIFELYVMTGVANSLRIAGYDVWLERSDGTRITPNAADRRFIQRGGAPTGVPSRLSGVNNASYIVFKRQPDGLEWEIWNGVQFSGKSGGSHEIDIAIVPRTTGNQLRNRPQGGRPIGRPRVSIECKDVALPGSVDEMRAFIARLYDLTFLNGHTRHFPNVVPETAINPGDLANINEHRTDTYRMENERTCNIIARVSGFVAGAAALTGYHYVRPHERIVVNTPGPAMLFDAVSNWCVAQGL